MGDQGKWSPDEFSDICDELVKEYAKEHGGNGIATFKEVVKSMERSMVGKSEVRRKFWQVHAEHRHSPRPLRTSSRVRVRVT